MVKKPTLFEDDLMKQSYLLSCYDGGDGCFTYRWGFGKVEGQLLHTCWCQLYRIWFLVQRPYCTVGRWRLGLRMVRQLHVIIIQHVYNLCKLCRNCTHQNCTEEQWYLYQMYKTATSTCVLGMSTKLKVMAMHVWRTYFVPESCACGCYHV